jgi:hypothetical protein
MDGRPNARCALAGQGGTNVAETMTQRKCIGSERFGIEAHEAPVTEFPAQPSQRDGLGRMCKTHWNQYTAGLARDAKARKAAAVGGTVGGVNVPATEAAAPTEAQAAKPEPTRKHGRRTGSAPQEGDVG